MKKYTRIAAVLAVLAAGVCAALPFRHSVAPPDVEEGAERGDLKLRAASPPRPHVPLRVESHGTSPAAGLHEPAPADGPTTVPSIWAPRTWDGIGPPPDLESAFPPLSDGFGAPAESAAPRTELDDALSHWLVEPTPANGALARSPAELEPAPVEIARRETFVLPPGSGEPAEGSPAAQSPPLTAVPVAGRSPASAAARPDPDPLPEVRHRVVDGDTLPELARRYLGDAGRYLELFEANRNVLSSPDLLPLGVELTIPPRRGAVE
jgi:nucleoid-associated protein YgaU